MAHVVAIEDPHDPRVADFVLLTDPDLRRARAHSGGTDGALFIAEGELVIRQLLRSSYGIRSFLLTPPRWASLEDALASVDAPVYVAGQEVVNAISGFHLHRGALAAADRAALPSVREAIGDSTCIVLGEGLNDHENLGALFRNAAAFGAGAVLLDPTSADPLYRRSVRVSMGHVLRVPFTRVDPWPAGLDELRQFGFEIVALTPEPGAIDVRAFRLPGRRAILVGAEGPGLSAAALAAADHRVRIPMSDGVDSLNVSTAAAVALYELTRG